MQTGPGLQPRDDIVLHVSAIFAENVLSRASLQSGVWGPEERTGVLPFARGQPFEMLILCDHSMFKVP
jgi:galectin-9